MGVFGARRTLASVVRALSKLTTEPAATVR